MNLPPPQPQPTQPQPPQPQVADLQPPAAARRGAWPRRLANALITLVVAAVAAGVFILTYSGVRAIAIQGGVSPELARYYPGLFDAVLVVACVAAVMLRDARWWARLWAWVVAIVVLAAIGVTDALHAMNYGLRHRPTEGLVATAPVLAVLLAFSLLVALLRHSRNQAVAARPQPAPAGLPAVAPTAAGPVPVDHVPTVPVQAVVPGFDAPSLEAADWEAAEWDGVGPEPRGAVTVFSAPAEPGPIRWASSGVRPLPAPRGDATGTGSAAAASTALEGTDAGATAPDGASVETVNLETGRLGDASPEATRLDGGSLDRSGPETGSADVSSADLDGAGADAGYDAELAGQVYPVAADAELGLPSGAELPTAVTAAAEVDIDAPPFATAPFAPVPRLKRVRMTPTPPSDDD